MRQRALGFSILSLIVVVMAAVTASTLAMLLLRSRENVTALGSTGNQFEAVEKALVAYAAQNKRLPCPASGTAGTGAALPATATTACTNPDGVVPWATLGLSRDAATDAWGGLISYRVYAGNIGLTQTDGASMVNCDTVEPSPQAVTGNGACRTQQDTLPATFLAGKGFTITDMGIAYADVAWMLMSHGPTGRGGFSNGNISRPAPTTGGDEASNASATGPFVRRAASDPTMLVDNVAHFDDLISYSRMADFMTKTGNVAREWPEPLPPPVSLAFNAAAISTALGYTVFSGQNTGQSSINFAAQNVTVQGFQAGVATSINVRATNGVDGLGVSGTGTVSSGSAEYLEVLFSTTGYTKFGLTLNSFGGGTQSGTPYQERVQVTFFNGSTSLGSFIKQSCRNGTVLASYTFTSPSAYTKVRVEPLSSTPAIRNSTFYVSEIRACPSTTPDCSTTIATSTPTSVCP